MQKKRSGGKRKESTDIDIQNLDDITMMMKTVLVIMNGATSVSDLIDITMTETNMTGDPQIEREEREIIRATAMRAIIE